MMKKRSELGLGSAFFGISDPCLVKKSFFETFLSQKLTAGPGEEILKIFFAGDDVSKKFDVSEHLAPLNLDTMSVPEALVHSVRIMVAPAVVLVRR